MVKFVRRGSWPGKSLPLHRAGGSHASHNFPPQQFQNNISQFLILEDLHKTDFMTQKKSLQTYTKHMEGRNLCMLPWFFVPRVLKILWPSNVDVFYHDNIQWSIAGIVCQENMDFWTEVTEDHDMYFIVQVRSSCLYGLLI